MPPPCFNATNVDPSSLAGILPRADGGSPVDSQPPPLSSPPPLPPFDAANINPPLIASGLLGVGGGLPADIQPPSPSRPQNLIFTITRPISEFDSDFDSDSDSQADIDSSKDHRHGYIPLVP
jgi:hypothetical protein